MLRFRAGAVRLEEATRCRIVFWPLVRHSGGDMTGSMTGLVIGSVHGIFDVALEGETLRCTLRGKLRKPHFQPDHPTVGPNRKGFSTILRFGKTMLPHQNTPPKGAGRATAVAEPPEEETSSLR